MSYSPGCIKAHRRSASQSQAVVAFETDAFLMNARIETFPANVQNHETV